MLNTDAHNPMVKNKMTKEGFLKNNRGINDGGDLGQGPFMEALYDRIVTNEIKMSDDADDARRWGSQDGTAASQPQPTGWFESVMALLPGTTGGHRDRAGRRDRQAHGREAQDPGRGRELRRGQGRRHAQAHGRCAVGAGARRLQRALRVGAGPGLHRPEHRRLQGGHRPHGQAQDGHAAERVPDVIDTVHRPSTRRGR